MGLFDRARARIGAFKFKRSELGRALSEHTHNYLYGETALASFEQARKDAIAQDFYSKVFLLSQADNAIMELRTMLVEYALAFTQLAVLCLTEDEKLDMFYRDNPYISGTLYKHIEQAADHVEELGKLRFEIDELTAADLKSYCNTRSALMLYYLNGFNLVRNAMGDSSLIDEKDWFRPMVEAFMVSEEDRMREKIGLPSLLNDGVRGLVYGAMMDYILNGDANPFYTWTSTWPTRYLAGHGPLPTEVKSS